MGQRINIQYSVDMDELSEEVERLLTGAYSHYGALASLCAVDSQMPMLSYETIENIDKVRLELGAIDYRLNDIYNIINGYLSYRAQSEATPTASISEEETLEDKLASFKQIISGAADQNEDPD